MKERKDMKQKRLAIFFLGVLIFMLCCCNNIRSANQENTSDGNQTENRQPEKQETVLNFTEQDDKYIISMTDELAAQTEEITYSILCENENEPGTYFSIVSGLEPDKNGEGEISISKSQSICGFYEKKYKQYVPITRMEYEEGHWKTEFTFLNDFSDGIDAILATVLDVNCKEAEEGKNLPYTLEQRDQIGINPRAMEYALANGDTFSIMVKAAEPVYDDNKNMLPFEKWEFEGFYIISYKNNNLSNLKIQKRGIEDFEKNFVLQAVAKLKDGSLAASDFMLLQEKMKTAETKEVNNAQGKFTFEILENEAKLIKYEGDSKEVSVPDQADGYPVTSIGTDAFPKYVGGPEKISLPDTVKNIEKSAFSSCENLKTLDLGEGVENIKYNAIAYCSELRELFIPASVKNMEEGAIISCDNLDKISVDEHNSYYKVENRAILSKDGKILYAVPEHLSGVYKISDTVEIIGKYAFNNCKDLTEVVFPDHLKKIHENTFQNTVLKVLNFPESLNFIGSGAFSSGDSSSWILDGYGVTDYKEVKLGKNLEWLGEGVFSGYCIQKFVVDKDNPYYKSTEEGVILSKDGTFLQLCPTNLNGELHIPEGVENIASNCFSGNGSMSQVMDNSMGILKLIFPKSLKYLDCLIMPEYLQEMEIHSDLEVWKNISDCKCNIKLFENGNYDQEGNVIYNKDKSVLLYYYNENNEKTLTFSENLKKIEANAICDPNKVIENIVISKGASFDDMTIQDISEIFNSITSLAAIDVEEGNEKICSEEGVLYDKEKKQLLVYPEKKTAKDFTIPEGVEIINKNICYNENIKKIIVPSSVNSFPTQFETLTEIEVSEENPYYGAEGPVFWSKKDQSVIFVADCAETVTIPDGIVTISEGVFSSSKLLGTGGSKVFDIYLPDGLTHIEGNNFNDLNNADPWDIIYIYIPESVTEISEESFVNSMGAELHVEKDSYAESFAIEHDLKYVIDPQ